MTQADLSNCDMTDTMLDYVVLRGANLRGSIAVNANFIRSDMGEIDATDVDFTDAIIDKVRTPVCSAPHGERQRGADLERRLYTGRQCPRVQGTGTGHAPRRHGSYFTCLGPVQRRACMRKTTVVPPHTTSDERLGLQLCFRAERRAARTGDGSQT